VQLTTGCALCLVLWGCTHTPPVPVQALLLAGLRLEEVAVTREIMDALGAYEVKVLLLYSEEAASRFQGGCNPCMEPSAYIFCCLC
jgi:hypothetical protein